MSNTKKDNGDDDDGDEDFDEDDDQPIIDLDAEDPFEAMNEAKKKRTLVKSNTQKLFCTMPPLGNMAQ